MSNAIPSGWVESSLEPYCEKITDGAHLSPPTSSEGFPIATVENMRARHIDIQSCRTISKSDFESLQRNSCAPELGDVLFSKDGTIGKTFVFQQRVDVVLLSSIAIIRTKKAKLVPEFLTQYLKSPFFFRSIEHATSGSAIRRVVLKDIKALPIKLPPVLEQQKIASILTAVDEVIESTTAQINKLKDLKTGMMQELLTKGIGRGGQPHTEFKDSPVGRIPKAWDVVRVGEVSKVIDSLHKTPIFCEQGWPMVRVTEIRQSNRLDMSKAVFVDEETFINFSKNYQPQIGDILVARVGAYFGSTTYVDREMTFCLGQNTAAVRPIGVHPEYLFSFFNSQVGRTQIDESVAGSGQPSFSLKAIKELVLALPSHDEQRKISDVIDSLAQRVRAKERQFALYLDIKKSLMQDLLTGKIRV